MCQFIFQVEQKKNSLSFMALGDFGGMPYYPYATPIEMAVAYRMAKFAHKNPIDFVLTLGDNFYFDGVKNVEDPRFQVRVVYLLGIIKLVSSYCCAAGATTKTNLNCFTCSNCNYSFIKKLHPICWTLRFQNQCPFLGCRRSFDGCVYALRGSFCNN